MRTFPLILALALVSSSGLATGSKTDEPLIRVAPIGNGITLHYVEEGSGPPVVFVHGSLSDGGYWSGQIGPFSKRYRVIAYSRRYNYPNKNPAQPGYSALTDAEDLAALVTSLHLGKVVVIGHSYGALVALFLAARRPDLVRALILAEPPAVNLLQYLPGREATKGKEMFDDIQQHMVAPMQKARLLPHCQTIVLPDAGHQMWYQDPEICRRDVEEFLTRNGVH